MIRAVILALLATSATANPLPIPTAQFPTVNMAEAELGQLLFYDRILSGNKTVSCATCHHPDLGTSDGLALGLGDGGLGLGPDRTSDPDNPPEQRIPRNSPALFNLGASEFTRFFHDGRLEQDATRPSGIRTPLGADMEAGFASALSAQSMFPVLSPDEMAGHYSENDVAQAVRQGLLTGPGGAWSILSTRIDSIPAYRAKFTDLIGDRPVHFTDIANVIASFIAFEWRADDSPFDRHLRGQTPLTGAADRGMTLFYGQAACSTCHAGQFQTDHDFHAIAMPQIGPGKAARFERHARDTGRLRVTGDPDDAYRFRTPPLRNIAQTAPYGHAGTYADLEAVIRHHLDPVAGLHSYALDPASLPHLPHATDTAILSSPDDMSAIAAANDLAPSHLSQAQIDDLIAFLNALSDQTSLTGRLGIPVSVPSGLPID